MFSCEENPEYIGEGYLLEWREEAEK